MPKISALPASNFYAGCIIPMAYNGVTWGIPLTSVSASMLNASNQESARGAIGAGTSSLAVTDSAPAALAALATAGTSSAAARADHVHAFPSQLLTARTIALSGGATATGSFNGSANLTLTVTLANPTGSVRGGILQQPAIPNITIAPTVLDINNILSALRAAGVIAT